MQLSVSVNEAKRVVSIESSLLIGPARVVSIASSLLTRPTRFRD
jgi:hypothetical protein